MKEKNKIEEIMEALTNEVINFNKDFVGKVITTLSQKTKLPLVDMLQKCDEQNEKDLKKVLTKGKIVRHFAQSDIPLIRMKIEFYIDHTFSIFLNGNGVPAKYEKISLEEINRKVITKIKKHMGK
jgi:hypothetical protein